MQRLFPSIAAVLLLLTGCSDSGLVTTPPVEAPAQHASAYPEVIPLPIGFSPEGVVVGNGSDFYVGSLAGGAIYKGDLRTGAGGILVPGQEGLLAVGLAFDARSNYLYVSGGFGGTARVYDAETGALVASVAAAGATPANFTNDVIVTRTAAYFTDSFAPALYRLQLGPQGLIPGSADLQTIPLGGDFVFIPATFNANGIEATPDGTNLFVVNGSAAELYRVDPHTGEATKIDLGGAGVPSGDGLVLEGLTLYVVQNFLNQIAEIQLAPDLASGEIVDVITSPLFRIPTTADLFGSSLYAVNARFDVAPPGVPNAFEFEVVRVQK